MPQILWFHGLLWCHVLQHIILYFHILLAACFPYGVPNFVVTWFVAPYFAAQYFVLPYSIGCMLSLDFIFQGSKNVLTWSTFRGSMLLWFHYEYCSMCCCFMSRGSMMYAHLHCHRRVEPEDSRELVLSRLVALELFALHSKAADDKVLVQRLQHLRNNEKKQREKNGGGGL